MIKQSGRQKINFIAQGDGQPVILVHGIAASARVWSNLITELVNAGYRVYALDLPGHGDSYKPEEPGHYHVHDIYSALEDWIDSLKLAKPPALIGHSLGGHLSLQYSLDHPQDVCRMILIDPYYSPKQIFSPARWLQNQAAIGAAAWRRSSGPLFDQLVIWNPIVSRKLAMNHRQQMAVDLKRASPLILHILPTVPDLTTKLGDIRIPTLVIWGSRDLTLRASTFTKLVSLLPNASAQKIVGTGHQPHLTTPEIVNSSILDFLATSP